MEATREGLRKWVNLQWHNFEDLPAFGPDVIAAADAAIGAYSLWFFDPLFSHLGFRLRDLHNGPISHLGLNFFNDIDHLIKNIVPQDAHTLLAGHRLLH